MSTDFQLFKSCLESDFFFFLKGKSDFFFLFFSFFSLGKKATASCLYLDILIDYSWSPPSRPLYPACAKSKKGFLAYSSSSTEIFIFPLYYIGVTLAISYVHSDEEKEIFAHLSTPHGS